MGQYEVSLFVGGGYHGSDYFDNAKDALAHIDALRAYDFSGKTVEVFVIYHNSLFQCGNFSCNSELVWTNIWTNKTVKD